MGTHRRVIAGHWEGQTIFRISTYPGLRVGTFAEACVSVSGSWTSRLGGSTDTYVYKYISHKRVHSEDLCHRVKRRTQRVLLLKITFIS